MENLRFGLEMTLFGMGTVFVLLLLLMVVLQLLGLVDRPRRQQPAAEPAAVDTTDDTAEPPTEEAPQVRVLADGLTDDQIAAITIAVLTHATVRRREAAPAMRRHQPGARLYASRWVASGRTGQQAPWTRPRPETRS